MKHKLTANNVFLILLLINIGFMVYFYNVNQGYWWDEAVYLGLAQNLNEGRGYWINVEGQEAFRPPLLPYLTAGLFSMGFTEPLVKALPPLFASHFGNPVQRGFDFAFGASFFIPNGDQGVIHHQIFGGEVAVGGWDFFDGADLFAPIAKRDVLLKDFRDSEFFGTGFAGHKNRPLFNV